MKVETCIVGDLETNCYLVYDETTKKCLIIDPGADGDMIISDCENLELKPEAILLTHGHFDHIGAAKELSDEFGIPIYAGEEEKDVLSDPRNNLSEAFSLPMVLEVRHFLKDDERKLLAGLFFRVIKTPGHTKGGICFYFPAESVLISGDILFNESYGRTDFPGGSMKEMISSIERLLELPDDVAVFPGHGPGTTIGWERLHNPLAFIRRVK